MLQDLVDALHVQLQTPVHCGVFGLGVVLVLVEDVLDVELVELVLLVELVDDVELLLVVVGQFMFRGSALTHTPLDVWKTSMYSQSGTATGKRL